MSAITEEEFRRMKPGAIIEVSHDSNIWELIRFKGHDGKDSCDRPHEYPTSVPSLGGQCSIDARWPEGVDKEHFMNQKTKTWIDPETSLEWEAGGGKEMPWEAAKVYANSLGDGWRLPTLRELETLVDLGAFDPACSKPIECFSEDYWSSTAHVIDNEYLWNVGFFNGGIYNGLESIDHYVRCVRTVAEKRWRGKC